MYFDMLKELWVNAQILYPFLISSTKVSWKLQGMQLPYSDESLRTVRAKTFLRIGSECVKFLRGRIGDRTQLFFKDFLTEINNLFLHISDDICIPSKICSTRDFSLTFPDTAWKRYF